MSLEICKLCNQDSTPFFHINGHICHDCYVNSQQTLEWVSVKDRLPNSQDNYICLDTKNNVSLRKFWIKTRYFNYEKKIYDKGTFFSNDLANKYITHWMPLPEPPISHK